MFKKKLYNEQKCLKEYKYFYNLFIYKKVLMSFDLSSSRGKVMS